jgi:hypothetical protein
VTFSVGSFMSLELTRPDAEASRSVLGLSGLVELLELLALLDVLALLELPMASDTVPVTSTLWFRCWLNDTLESDVLSRNDDPAGREDAAPVRSMLVRTNWPEAPVAAGVLDVGEAALPAPEPLPVAGAIVRLSHVFRHPVRVVDVLAMSELGAD